ncbi:MAG TPA: dioxygenase [Usitatibacter sp.]|nr:dioxygenase [Usitatibacter sp.]
MAEQDRLSITRAAIDRLDDCTDLRFRRVMTALIRHLHDFVREVDLTEDEWLTAIRFLTDTGRMCDERRQEFILLSDTLGASMLTVMLAQSRGRRRTRTTDATVMGPFFREGAPILPLGADISEGVEGEPALYRGRILDEQGRPIAGAAIDVWSSDAKGFYDVQVGEAMKARARFTSDDQGRYRFWSVRPAHYPIPTDGPVGRMLRAMGRHAWRPAHMHFMVRAPGHAPLVTHIFDANSPYLDSDAVFGVRDSLIVDFERHEPGRAPDGRSMERPYCTVDFDVRLAAVLPRRKEKTMATTKQRKAAKRNVKKAAAAAKRKRTISKLPKKTRTALGKQAAKVAKKKRKTRRS